MEHPEDLGVTNNGDKPASIWQLAAVKEVIAKAGAASGALFQCRFPRALSSKPTRLAGNLAGLKHQ
eukprot:1295731-Karenia_brevis.AAC.1